MQRDSFEIFKGNVCHYIKDNGELKFIHEVLVSRKVYELYERKWYAE